MTMRADMPDSGPMTPDRLRTLFDAYGAAPAHWPQAERASASALIDSSSAARALLAEATQLDALLDLVRSPSPSTRLAERLRHRHFGWRGWPVVGTAEKFGQYARRWMANPRHQAIAVVIALAVGAALGAGLPDAFSVRALAGGASGPETVAIDTQTENLPFALATDFSGRYSSNANPALEAPDPFGIASHGMDLVAGGRIAGVPVPVSGEPIGSIPLL